MTIVTVISLAQSIILSYNHHNKSRATLDERLEQQKMSIYDLLDLSHTITNIVFTSPKIMLVLSLMAYGYIDL